MTDNTREGVQAMKSGPSEAGAQGPTLLSQLRVEARIRADQTQRIVEWLRTARAGQGICGDEGAWLEAAKAVAREFGATTHAE